MPGLEDNLVTPPLPQLIRLEVPGDIQHREVALRTISAACKIAFPDNGATVAPAKAFHEEVLSAVGEAFNNIALHAYRGCPAGVIEIEIAFDDKALAIELRDYGRSFDITKTPMPDLSAMPESGLGVFIMSSFMDRVDYSAGHPNVLKLVKRLG